MTPQAQAEQYAADAAAIRQAALDYMQGWYEGDAERMRRCLHPELAKRAMLRDRESGLEQFHHLNRQQMVAKTQQGGGTQDVPPDQRYYEVTILDVYGEIASVRADSYGYVDYLHLARSEGHWQIVNVLYAFRHTSR